MTNIVADMNDVLKTEGGRRVIAYVLDISGMETSSFTGDATRDTFDTGRRSVGLQVASLAREADIDLYLKTLKENYNGN